MKLVMLNGPTSQLGKVIQALCSDGNFHPEKADSFISPTMGYAPMNEENPYQATISVIKDLANQFHVDLETSKKVKGTVIDDKAQEYVELLERRLRDFASQAALLNEQIETCREGIAQYSHFLGLGVNLDEIFACKFIVARFGHLSKDSYLKLTRGYGEHPFILFVPCSTDSEGYWGVYFAPREHEDEVDRIFASLHFDRMHIPSAVGTTEEIIARLDENISIIQQQQNELHRKIVEIWQTEGDKICALYAKLVQASEIFELRKFAVFHEKNCFYVGWIPARGEKRLRDRLEKFTAFSVEIEDPEKGDRISPPTHLKNLIFFRPYSFFVEMYGLPSYHDIDITGFVAITFTLLFGIMFGDVGQGFALILVGLAMWKLKRMALGKILIPCGCASMVFGFVFGSVFGFEEALDPLYEKLGMPGKPISVMDSINTVLVFAIGIGIALVVVAMCLNIVSSLKKGKIGTALFSENGLTGIAVYLAGVSLVYHFMANKTLIPQNIAVLMLAIGLLILFNKEIIAGSVDEHKFVKPESVSDYIMQNLFETIEYVLSYFSNTVSFLRVGAFVIVHASMMMVVFTLAGDPKSVKGIVVIILGNVLVIALEGLLSGIQGLRLEFYEMFSRFYEGEGRAFEAAKLHSFAEKQRKKIIHKSKS